MMKIRSEKIMMMNEPKRGRKPLYFIFVFLILILGIGVPVYFYIDHQRDEIKKEKQEELSSIANMKMQQIMNWRNERIHDVAEIRENPIIQNFIYKYLRSGKKYQERQELLIWMQSMKKLYGYKSISLIDSKGFRLLSYPNETYEKNIVDSCILKVLPHALQKEDIVFSDLHRSDSLSPIHIELIVPFHASAAKTTSLQCLLLFHIDPEKFLYPLIQTWPTPSRSSETMLIHKEGNDVVFLNELRHQKNTALKLRFPISEKLLPAAIAARGFEGTFEGIDYRGVPVLAATVKIPNSPWFMIAKVDQQEIYEAASRRTLYTSTIVGVFIIAVGLGIGLIWQNQKSKYKHKQLEDELENKLLSQRYDYLAKYANDIIILTDEATHIVEANDSATIAYQFTRDELLQLSSRELRSDVEQHAFDALINKIEEQKVLIAESIHRRKDGSTFPVEASTRLIEINGQKFYQSIIRDITERKKSEQQILNLNRIYAVLGNINQTIVRVRSKQRICDEACRIAVEDGKFILSWIGFIQEDIRMMNVAASYGQTDGFMESVRHSLMGRWFDHNSFASSIQKGESVICNNIEQELQSVEWYNDALKYGCKSFAAFPIQYANEILGVITFYSQEINFFNEAEIKLLDEVALDVSYAMEFLEKEERRQKAEQSLRESEQRFKILFDSAPLSYQSVDINENLLDVNQVWLDTLGYSRDEVIGQWFGKFMTSASAMTVNNIFSLLKTTGEVHNIELEMVRKNGTHFWALFEGRIGYDAQRNFKQTHGIFTDITERKQTERELKKLYEAVEQSPASILITDLEGNIEYVNKTFEETTGYALNEVLHHNPRILKSEYTSAEEYKNLWDTITSGKTWRGEFLNKKKNGVLYWEDAIVSPVKDKNDNIINYIGVKQDITEKKKVTEELIAAKERAEHSDKLKDAFIANMSHEIRTPLNIITGYSSVIKELLADRVQPEESILFENLQHGSERLMRTVDEILNYSRIQTGDVVLNRQYVDMHELLHQMISSYRHLAEKKSLSITFIHECGSISILADEYYITQAISNLIDNAIKYTKEGSVEIRLYSDSENEIYLDVKDTGIGISDEYLQHIFKPYSQEEIGYSRPYEGIGLGLALVKQYIDLHGGTISVKSTKNIGTTFTIHLPNVETAVKPIIVQKGLPQKITEMKPVRSGKEIPGILLVEDDAETVEYMNLILRAHYKIFKAANAHSAWDILTLEKVDMILMDISLQGETDGLTLTKEIRNTKRYCEVPIIAVTAHAYPKDREKCLRAGCNEFIKKPMSKRELFDKMEMLLMKNQI